MSFSSNKTKPNNIDLDSSQTLSNKTLDSSTVIQSGATITTPSIVSPTRLDPKKDTYANLTTYALTAQNGELVYATDTKKQFQVRDGLLTEIAGGSSGINYLQGDNSDFELGAGDWTEYADAANTIPVDGDGAGATVTIEQSSTSTLLRGEAHGIFTKDAANRQGEGAVCPFTIDEADQAKMLTISFDYITSVNYADADIKVFVYDVTNSQLIRVNGEDLKAVSGSGKHYAQFQTAPDSTSYRLILHVSSTNASTYTIRLDNMQLGPREITRGAIITEWESGGVTVITASTTNPTKGTTSLDETYYRRVGDSLEVRVAYTQSGAGVAGSGDYLLEIPNGLSINTSKLTADTGIEGGGSGFTLENHVGTANFNTGNNNGQKHVVVYDSTHIRAAGISGDNANNNSVGAWGSSFYDLSATDLNFTMNFTVPIQGWASSGTLNEDLGGGDVVVVARGVDSTSLTGGSRILFTEVSDSASAYASGIFTAPSTGQYIFSGSVYEDVASTAAYYIYDVTNSTILEYTGKTSSDRLKPINNTIDLIKGQQVDIRPDLTFTVSNAGTLTYLKITKLASGSQKFETATVAAIYTSNSGTVTMTNGVTSDIEFEDLVQDTHGAYNTSTGVYTAPMTGFYQVNFIVSIVTASSVGTIIPIVQYASGAEIVRGARFPNKSTETYGASLSAMIYLNKGEEIQAALFQNTGADFTLAAGTSENRFSIHRIK